MTANSQLWEMVRDFGDGNISAQTVRRQTIRECNISSMRQAIGPRLSIVEHIAHLQFALQLRD